MAHVLPIYCRLFDPHTIKGFYVGVWMEHNRCFKIFIPSTVRVRIADTVIWSPHVSLKIHIPIKDEIIRRAIDDLCTTIQLSLKNNILTPEGTTSRKTMLDIIEIFNNWYLRDPPNKPPTYTNVLRVKVWSKDTTIVPRVQLHTNDTTRAPRVKPSAATTSPQPTLQRSKRICNLVKTIVSHNINETILLSALEEKFISEIMNINAVLNPTIGNLLELHQLLKTSESKPWRYEAFNEFARLAQGSKKRTIKVTNTIHFISPNQKPN